MSCGVDATVLREGAAEGGSIVDASTPFDGVSAADANGVFAGQSSACALSNGSASCWGGNAQGDLGTGDDAMRDTPTSVETSQRFVMLAAGNEHVCAIRAPDARVMCWGDNSYGQLGLASAVSSFATPQLVALPGPARWVTAGYEHTCAVLYDGSLWCWGDNTEGQLGLDDAYGSPNASAPVHVGSARDWITVSGGQGHTCGIRRGNSSTAGTMWCWGRNTAYELGLGTVQPEQIRGPTQVTMPSDAGMLSDADWTFVELGQDDACALRSDGTLWGWGAGMFGQLGVPAGPFEAPTQIGSDIGWLTVSTDTFTTCGIQSGGALYCWGRNVEGELGTGDMTDRTVPTLTGGDASFVSVSVGRLSTCAESAALGVMCTGADESGELGVGDTMRRDVFTPVSLPATQ
jgi:alpha-tubulin suppressor-like RCC1 family protein